MPLALGLPQLACQRLVLQVRVAAGVPEIQATQGMREMGAPEVMGGRLHKMFIVDATKT